MAVNMGTLTYLQHLQNKANLEYKMDEYIERRWIYPWTDVFCVKNSLGKNQQRIVSHA